MPQFDVLSTKALPSDLVAFVEPLPLPALDEAPTLPEADQLPALLKTLDWESTLAASGLWLLLGDLHSSHEISQNDGSAEGSFWHGVMHRREGDFGNSKYWFRRVGDHAVHSELATCIERNRDQLDEDLQSDQLLVADELAEHLVDLCRQAPSSSPNFIASLKQICWWEWQLLFGASAP